MRIRGRWWALYSSGEHSREWRPCGILTTEPLNVTLLYASGHWPYLEPGVKKSGKYSWERR